MFIFRLMRTRIFVRRSFTMLVFIRTFGRTDLHMDYKKTRCFTKRRNKYERKDAKTYTISENNNAN